MNEALTLDQKIEILKLVPQKDFSVISEEYRKLVALLMEDRCRKCRDSLKNVFSEALERSEVGNLQAP
jgi:hypothetical protein